MMACPGNVRADQRQYLSDFAAGHEVKAAVSNVGDVVAVIHIYQQCSLSRSSEEDVLIED